MQIEFAKFTHIGNRQENQDRVEVLIGDHTALAMVLDGMGGHSDGAAAAMTAVATMSDRFRNSKQPLPFPERFLTRTIGDAHTALVELGKDAKINAKPRATCVVCLVQKDVAHWAHLGDSRIYHVRDNKIIDRTRDHTHVELLLQEGLIFESEIASHPMRSFVEHCLGGDRPQPPVTSSGPHQLEPDDMLVLCSDGFWGGLTDAGMGDVLAAVDVSKNVQDTVEELVTGALKRNAPGSDNATVAAIIWRGTD